MKKRTNLYSEVSALTLALVSDFSGLFVTDNQMFGMLKYGKSWVETMAIPGSIRVNAISDEEKHPTNEITIKYRVSYQEIDNLTTLEKWLGREIIASYITGGGNRVACGSKEFPLSFSFSMLEDFEGYECTLKGSSTAIHSFF